jgi:hypothetical protein
MKIDPEFRDQIWPLSPDEQKILEDNIVKEGCRDALVVWKEKDILLDGHHRYEICKRHKIEYKEKYISLPDREAAADWIDRNQLGRRNLTKDQWLVAVGRLYNRTKKAVGGRADRDVSGGQNDHPKTSEVLAKEYGVGEATVRRGGALAKEVAECAELMDALKNKVPVRKAKEQMQRVKRTAARTKAAKSITLPVNKNLIVGDFRKNADKIADGSLSLIFTDPPYDRKASEMLPDLGAFAKAKLAEGGSLMLYVGGTQLLDALDAIRPHLRYWWTVACIHAGGKTIMREYGLKAGWKAVLWFVKGTRDNKLDLVEDTMSGGKEKDTHEWQQAESEAAYWIEHLCPKDGIVCDPFLGGGTTAAAAKKLGRKWIGFEIEEDIAKIASERIGKA